MDNFYLCNSAALQANLSKSAFKVYSFLSMSANNQTRSSFYKRSSIAKFCHMSESTVIRAVRELCEKGLLEVKRRFLEKGQQTSNDYVLIDNPQLTTDDIAASQEEPEQSRNDCADTVKVSQNGAQDKPRLFRCSSVGFQVKLSPSEMKVYSCLSFRAGKSRQCKPAKRAIAADCGMSVATVTRAIRKLRKTGLITVIQQTRLECYGNNGNSVNLYIMNARPDAQNRSGKHLTDLWKALFYLFFVRLTPSPISPVTPHRTMSRMKVTLKQRKEYLISQLTKWYTMHIYPEPPWEVRNASEHNKFHDTG